MHFGRGDFILYNYLDHAAKGLTILATVNRVYDFCMYVLYSCHSRRKVFTFHMCIYDSMERWVRQLPFNCIIMYLDFIFTRVLLKA